MFHLPTVQGTMASGYGHLNKFQTDETLIKGFIRNIITYTKGND